MRARHILLAAAVAAGLPAAALAQDAAAQAAERQRLELQLRAAEAQQNLRNYEVQQRAADIDTRITDLDLRQRTQQNLAASTPAPTYYPTDLRPALAPQSTIDLRAQATMQNKELDAQNARLKQLDQAGSPNK